jgi:hypothetical protein
MPHDRFVACALVAGVLCGAGTAQLLGQSSAGASPDWTMPRTPWGDPDLQGIWPSSDMIGVPLQRAPELGTRNVLTDEEFAQRLQQAERQAVADSDEFGPGGAADPGGIGPPPHWLERGSPQRQASLIVRVLRVRVP